MGRVDFHEREQLIEELSASLDVTDLGDYWETETKWRIENVDSGRVKPVSADEVLERLEQRFGGR